MARILVLAIGTGACGQTAVPLNLVVAPSGSVTVRFPNAGASARPLLLFSGMLAGACVAYQPFVGSPTVQLDAVSRSDDCRTEIDVFTSGFGAYAKYVSPGDAAAVAWFDGAITSGSVGIVLGQLQPVDVSIWLVASGADVVKAETAAAEQLLHAGPILEKMGAGVALMTRSAIVAPSDLDPACNNAGVIKGGSKFDAGRLNVYFTRILDNSTWFYAMNCWIQGFPDVIFISYENEYTPIVALAHEVGHALGLVRPAGTFNQVGGHTQFYTGINPSPFHDDNLMWSGAADIDNISIGQMYHMNFDVLSWLNTSGVWARPLVQDCQVTWDAGACPALSMFVAGWP